MMLSPGFVTPPGSEVTINPAGLAEASYIWRTLQCP